MSARLPDPERWTDCLEHDTKAEGQLGAVLRRVKRITEPSAEDVEALARRINQARPRELAPRRAWRVVVAAAVVFLMSGAVGAARYVWKRRVTTSAVEATPAPAAVSPRSRGSRVTAATGDDSLRAPTAPVLEAPSAEGRPAEVGPALSATTLHRTVRPAAPPDEAAVLAAAFRVLRSESDPGGALRALDQYDRRFPAGVLRGEARIARAEALMAQDRRSEALPLLAALSDGDGALTRGVLVTRGELLAEAGRCVEAVRDFSRVLVSVEDDAAGGRALYGRASCRLVAHEVAGAREDLRRYLALHPAGAFAPAARRALEDMP